MLGEALRTQDLPHRREETTKSTEGEKSDNKLTHQSAPRGFKLLCEPW
jgi:hypothetical protein